MLDCSAKLKDVFGETRPLGSLDNRKFWKNLGPVFSEKGFPKESINLNNKNKTISNNEELAEIINKHFSKIVENLDIDQTLTSNIASSDITNLFCNAIKKYEDHLSIKKPNIS